MALAIRQVHEGAEQSVGNSTATLYFRIEGSLDVPPTDWFNTIAQLALTAPEIPAVLSTTAGLLYRQDMRIVESTYGRQYLITVPFGKSKKDQEPGAYSIAFSQTGGTVHQKVGRWIANYGDDKPAAPKDNVAFIGQDPSNNTVEGVDLPVADSKIIVSFRHPGGALNTTYIKAIAEVVGYPNEDEFLGYEPGEVRFMGGDFGETEAEATATYNFEIKRNRRNIKIGDVTVDEATGFDVIDVEWKKDKDTPRAIVRYVTIIRPREWIPYQSVFGWGG